MSQFHLGQKRKQIGKLHEIKRKTEKIEGKGLLEPQATCSSILDVLCLLMFYQTNEEKKEKRGPIVTSSFKFLFGLKKI